MRRDGFVTVILLFQSAHDEVAVLDERSFFGINIKRSVRAAENVTAVGPPYASVKLIAVKFIAPRLNVITVVDFNNDEFFISAAACSFNGRSGISKLAYVSHLQSEFALRHGERELLTGVVIIDLRIRQTRGRIGEFHSAGAAFVDESERAVAGRIRIELPKLRKIALD